MQFETAALLQTLLPCGHCVLPINLEEKLFEGLLKSQLTWLKSHAYLYQMVKGLRKPADRCDDLRLEHIKSSGDAYGHLKVTGRSISKEFVSKVSFGDCLKGNRHTPHSPQPVYTEGDTSLYEPEDDAAASSLKIDEHILGDNNPPVDRVSPSLLKDVVAQCVVVETQRTTIEDIEPPASPDSISEPVCPSSPKDHSDVTETLPTQPAMPEGK
ncbi:unnamed protein product [Dibothriocephalus latus]|uniref:Uncharacterized protein n=1 Tax=Dibothriocephalus latus TaxID=60516 RepID=A0A3P7LAG2_DIBLA|nr:unnamed protein product [Dibothriocephalus latus]